MNVQDVIQVHRRYLVELMQQWTRIKEAEADSDLSLALVVDAELFRLDAVVRWLDASGGRILRAGAGGPGGAGGRPPCPAARPRSARTRCPGCAEAPGPPGKRHEPAWNSLTGNGETS